MTSEVFIWWALLCTVSALNIAAWLVSAVVVERRHPLLSAELRVMRRLQVLLCAGYVFGCAFRSAFPVFDVPRLVVFDTWLSSVVVGRSVATFAELCFAGQWALMMCEISRSTGNRIARFTSIVVFPLIVVAEIFSWYSVLTTSNLGHVFEESIWGASAVLLVLSLAAIWRRSETSIRSLLAIACAIGVGYIGFMFLVDVPMYWSRWIADESSGRVYLGLWQGLADISGRWTVSHDWAVWQSEVVWMTLYFSAAVWLSIAIIHAPVLERRTDTRAQPVRQPARVAGSL
jgi:hypothetical protein